MYHRDSLHTHILYIAKAMLVVVPNIELEDGVENINDLPVIDDLLVGEIPHTCLNEGL